jgi:NAD(P)-dependent dehydrogenase (short-subunit alcohol dehydrogenase family)
MGFGTPVKLPHDYFGRLDIIVNNAGYGQFGMVEEISEAEIRAQLETKPEPAPEPPAARLLASGPSALTPAEGCLHVIHRG